MRAQFLLCRNRLHCLINATNCEILNSSVCCCLNFFLIHSGAIFLLEIRHCKKALFLDLPETANNEMFTSFANLRHSDDQFV